MTFTKLKISETVIKILSDHADFCFLMGSAETENFRADSDIDIAVFWKADSTNETKRQSDQKLQQELEREIDLISLNAIDDIFGRQVLEKGRLLFSHSDGLLLQWKMQQLSRYPDFKATRKVIEDNILTRKKYV